MPRSLIKNGPESGPDLCIRSELRFVACTQSWTCPPLGTEICHELIFPTFGLVAQLPASGRGRSSAVKHVREVGPPHYRAKAGTGCTLLPLGG